MIKQCVICGAEFNARNISYKYCSDDCQKKGFRLKQRAYAKRKREEKNARGIKKPQKRKFVKMTYKEKPCARCGKMFKPEHSSYKYCSFICRYPNTKKYVPEVKELSPLAKDNEEAREKGLTYGQWRGLQILRGMV